MKKRMSTFVFLAGLCLLLGGTLRAADLPPVQLLDLKGTISDGGSLSMVVPDGPKGWYPKGFRRENDSSVDWRSYYGVQFDVEYAGDAPVELTATISIPPEPAREALVPRTAAKVSLSGAGPHRITLPWNAFDFNQSQPGLLKFVKELKLSAKGGAVTVKAASVVRGERVAASSDVLGKSAEQGGQVEYTAHISNCTDAPQSVALSFERVGWEAMTPTVEPAVLRLAPGATSDVKVTVRLSPRVPAGGREKQVLRAVANGSAASAATLTFVTAAALPHPYILHTPARWQEVKDKVAKYPWAKEAQAEIVQKATKWNVPEVTKAPKNLTGVDNMGPFLFPTTVELDLMPTAMAYQLTGDSKFAEKVRTFLLRLSDPKDGYPTTLRGCNQSLVQEGHFFQHIAMAYDMALPSGLFTQADKDQVHATFRLLIETMDWEQQQGSINNWNLSELTGAMYCALAMQDLSTVDRFYRGPNGAIDQLGKGVLDDGWWYECAISYNVWCTTEFTQIALALEPWGENFKDMAVPVGFASNYSLRPFDNVDGLYGQSFQKWGPITHNFVNIRRMWDALPKFTDYRGVMFGVNDATERRVTGEPYEIAYYVYRDPVYATLIKQGGGKRDLIYGVPELPETSPEKFRDSAYADNVGVAMLRSQTPDRPIREQIQTALHYGTHGGFHGHFDRTGLLSLMRYGRSFFNPEMVWYSYAPFMYKFYVQNSTSKNMVVVDRKMQEPIESERLLWHTGRLFQATAVQTKARWSTPPYGGMLYPEQGYKTLQDKSFGEGRYLPKPEKEPEYGSVTEFTEPVLQRRLMIVTDDYVVLADYLKGEKEHTFENLYQMKGFKGLEATDKKLVRHDAQWESNPILDAQFVTDCDWYAAKGPSKSRFEMKFGPGADNAGTRAPESEDGVLNLDVHSLWPTEQSIMVGTVPEEHGNQKQLFYAVRGDDKTLADGKFGSWILGRADVDVSVNGLRQLVLETKVSKSDKSTIFWGNARIVTEDGKEIPLASLPMKHVNTQQPKETGRDYYGGPIKIVGIEYNGSIPAEPDDEKQPGVITVDLSGIKASRFKAVLGGDYPLGNEAQRRKTYAIQSKGTAANFLTVIEPYEDKTMVKSAQAVSADELRVELSDGRVQTIRLTNFEGDGKDIGVSVAESGGREPRSERTGS